MPANYTSGAAASQASGPISIGFTLLLLIYVKRAQLRIDGYPKRPRIRAGTRHRDANVRAGGSPAMISDAE